MENGVPGCRGGAARHGGVPVNRYVRPPPVLVVSGGTRGLMALSRIPLAWLNSGMGSGEPGHEAGPVVSGRDLVVRRGGQLVLDDLTFSLPPAVVPRLLGPSGCGKTTLMRVLVGVQAITAGTVTVLGLPAGHPRLRARLGYATQAPAVYTDLTLGEDLQ